MHTITAYCVKILILPIDLSPAPWVRNHRKCTWPVEKKARFAADIDLTSIFPTPVIHTTYDNCCARLFPFRIESSFSRIFDPLLFQSRKRAKSSKLSSNLTFISILHFIRIFWIVESFSFSGYGRKERRVIEIIEFNILSFPKSWNNGIIIEIIIEFNVHFDFTFHACNFIVQSFLIFDTEGKRDVQSFITTLYRNFDPLLFRVSKVIREHHHRNYHRIQRSFRFYVPQVCFESSSLFLFTEEKRDVWSLLFLCSSPIFDPLTYRPFVSKIVREIVIEIIIFDFTFHALFPIVEPFLYLHGHGRKEEPCLLSTVTQRTLKKKKKRKQLEHLENVSSPGASETRSIQL